MEPKLFQHRLRLAIFSLSVLYFIETIADIALENHFIHHLIFTARSYIQLIVGILTILLYGVSLWTKWNIHLYFRSFGVFTMAGFWCYLAVNRCMDNNLFGSWTCSAWPLAWISICYLNQLDLYLSLVVLGLLLTELVVTFRIRNGSQQEQQPAQMMYTAPVMVGTPMYGQQQQGPFLPFQQQQQYQHQQPPEGQVYPVMGLDHQQQQQPLGASAIQPMYQYAYAVNNPPHLQQHQQLAPQPLQQQQQQYHHQQQQQQQQLQSQQQPWQQQQPVREPQLLNQVSSPKLTNEHSKAPQGR